MALAIVLFILGSGTVRIAGAETKRIKTDQKRFLSAEIRRLQNELQRHLSQHESNRLIARERNGWRSRLDLIEIRARHAGLDKNPPFAKKLQVLRASMEMIQEKAGKREQIAGKEFRRLNKTGKMKDLDKLKILGLLEQRAGHSPQGDCWIERGKSDTGDLGTVSGRISDSLDNSPLSDVEVALYDSSGCFAGFGTTDAGGAYQITDMPAGTYFGLTFNYQGYLDELYDNIPCTGGRCDPTTGSPIAVVNGQETPGIDFELDLGGAISGRVFDAKKETAVVDASIYIYDLSGDFVAYGFTDSEGRFSAGGLGNGSYFAVTSNYGGYLDELYNNIPCPLLNCNPASGTTISVTVSQTTTGIDFGLDTGGIITGKVTDSKTRLPIPDVFISVYDPQGNFATYGYTDERGLYSAGGLASGNYFAQSSNYNGYVDELYRNIPCPGSLCDPTTGTSIAVRIGTKTRNINFALDQAGSLEGRVTSSEDGAPLADVSVYVLNSTGEFVSYGYTDLEGKYTAIGLSTGNYFVVTANYLGYVDELYDNISCPGLFCDVQSGTPVAVQFGEKTANIDFVLNEGGSISGTVAEAPGSQTLADVEVEVFDSNGNFMSYGYSDSEGNYTAGGLATGSYYARTFNYAGYVDELYDNSPCVSCDVTLGTLIPVAVGSETPGIDFELEKGGSISGRITSAWTGDPIADTGVEIFNSQGTFVSYGYSDFSGNYQSYGGLAAGNYFARTDNYQGFIDELFDNILCPDEGCDPTSGTAIAVSTGADTGNVDFALQSE